MIFKIPSQQDYTFINPSIIIYLLFPGVSSNPSMNQPGREKDIRLAVDLEDLWVHPGCPPQGSRRKLGDPRTDKKWRVYSWKKKQQILENPLNNL